MILRQSGIISVVSRKFITSCSSVYTDTITTRLKYKEFTYYDWTDWITTTTTITTITLPKVNRFGWSLEYSEYVVWGWPCQILGASCIVATAGEPGKIFCQVSYARFHRFPVSQISQNSVLRWKHSEQNFENFTSRGRFSKKRKNFFKHFNVMRLQAAIALQWLQIERNSLSK